MKGVLLPSIERHLKNAVELMELIKKEYKINEKTKEYDELN
jgi:hypothetical protein